jgi:hypothetical protein
MAAASLAISRVRRYLAGYPYQTDVIADHNGLLFRTIKLCAPLKPQARQAAPAARTGGDLRGWRPQSFRQH